MKRFTLDQAPRQPYDLSRLPVPLTPALIRVRKDLEELLPWPAGVTVAVSEDDPLSIGMHYAPQDGPYVGGHFRFDIGLKPSYPHDPPSVKCAQRVFHPNIDKGGAVCLNILRLDWSPVLSLSAVVFGIILLFDEPNPTDALNQEAMQRAPREFGRLVHEAMAGGAVAGFQYDRVLLPENIR